MTDNKPDETLETVDKLGKSIDRFISAVEEATVARDKANTMFAQLANTELPMSEVLHQMDKQKAWQVLQLLYAAEYIETGNLKKAISIVEDYPEQNAMQQDGLREAVTALLTAVKYGGLTTLPGGSGKGYLPRIPDTFVTDVEQALAGKE